MLTMFRIGEFSKIAQVSGHLLRYYDEIGLFKPAKIDEWTGYRSYSAAQLPRLNRILALKELGFNLEQIGDLLEDELSSTEIRSMLTLRKAQIEQSVQEEMLRLRHIEARLSQIDREGALQDDDIVVKSVPEQHFLAFRYQLPHLKHGARFVNGLMDIVNNSLSKKQVRHFAAVFHSDMFSAEDVDVLAGFVLSEPVDVNLRVTDNHSLTLQTLPAVETMVTVVRPGLPQVGHFSYAAIGAWIETNGYQIAGLGREVFLVPPWPGKEADTIVEIQFPVTLS